jgi:DNA-binding SARP family transcriptional activator
MRRWRREAHTRTAFIRLVCIRRPSALREMATKARLQARSCDAPGKPALSLLAGFELNSSGEVVRLPYASQRLLAFLAFQSRPVQRSFVSASLWPDIPGDKAAARLRSAMWRASSGIGDPIVRARGPLLLLDPGVTVDFRETVAWAEAVGRGQLKCDPDSWSLLASASKELLPDWYEEWVLAERERFRQLRLHALEIGGEQLVEAGHYAEALMAGLAAVAAEPLRESGHRLVIRAHMGEGNLYEAYRQYRACADLFESEIGVAPSPALQSLMAPLDPSPTSPRQRRPRRGARGN